MSLPKNLTGLVFGRLTVLQIDRTKTRRSWLCSCSCGGQKVVAQGDLLRGDTESCGCIKRERLAAMSKMGKVDHDTLTVGAKRAYRKWTYMWNRVRNPAGKSICYADVTVCEDWKNFYLFHRDMGEPPVGQSLDRIDNEKGYSPQNCRWATYTVQNNNRGRIPFRLKRALESSRELVKRNPNNWDAQQLLGFQNAIKFIESHLDV